jgi:hypothetical protein
MLRMFIGAIPNNTSIPTAFLGMVRQEAFDSPLAEPAYPTRFRKAAPSNTASIFRVAGRRKTPCDGDMR